MYMHNKNTNKQTFIEDIFINVCLPNFFVQTNLFQFFALNNFIGIFKQIIQTNWYKIHCPEFIYSKSSKY